MFTQKLCKNTIAHNVVRVSSWFAFVMLWFDSDSLIELLYCRHVPVILKIAPLGRVR